MIINKLRFESFLDVPGYCNLQMEFLKYDEDYPSIKKLITNPERELSISGSVLFSYADDSALSQYVTDEIMFEKDFLLPSINLMSKNYMEMLSREAENKGVLTLEGRDVFAQEKIIIIRSYLEKIADANFLTKEIKEMLTTQLSLIEDGLQSWIHNPIPDFKKKLQFNLIRADVIYFFHLLKKNNVINDMGDAELGRIIDTICTCLRDEKSKVYLPIARSRKDLNDYRHSNNNNNNIENSIKM